MGIVAYNCSCLAQDVSKIFSVYWYMGQPGATIPPKWPMKWSTHINSENPLALRINDTPATGYISVSPQNTKLVKHLKKKSL